MHITDPVADMLTRIRNANSAKHETVDVPASNLKKAIAQILLEEGYIKSYSLVDNGNQGTIHITLKYLAKKQPALSGLKRVSKPGLRIYAGADELPKVLKGLGESNSIVVNINAAPIQSITLNCRLSPMTEKKADANGSTQANKLA